MEKSDKQLSENVININNEIERRIEIMEGEDYRFPPRIKQIDFIGLCCVVLLCLICVIILKVICLNM